MRSSVATIPPFRAKARFSQWNWLRYSFSSALSLNARGRRISGRLADFVGRDPADAFELARDLVPEGVRVTGQFPSRVRDEDGSWRRGIFDASRDVHGIAP